MVHGRIIDYFSQEFQPIYNCVIQDTRGMFNSEEDSDGDKCFITDNNVRANGVRHRIPDQPFKCGNPSGRSVQVTFSFGLFQVGVKHVPEIVKDIKGESG